MKSMALKLWRVFGVICCLFLFRMLRKRGLYLGNNTKCIGLILFDDYSYHSVIRQCLGLIEVLPDG